jgi:transposase
MAARLADRPTYIPLALPPPATATADVPAGSGLIEIELAGGHRVRAATGADLTLLQGAIAALLGR